jgi:hypothetical protein
MKNRLKSEGLFMTSKCAEGLWFVGGLVMMVMTSGGLVLAHHGDSGRYEDTLTIVTGTVADIVLVNPHSTLVLDVKDASGKVVRWRGELGSAVALRDWCWSPDLIKTGDTVSMKGRRLKNGSPYMTLSEEARVTTAAGKEIYKGNEPGQSAEPGPCASTRTARNAR